MLLDNEKLISLLAANNGIDYDKAEKYLNELITNIKKAAQKGEEYPIEGFGSFKIVDDKITFQPTENLLTEINYKYAGMEPIELSPAVTADDEVEDLDENRVKGIMGDTLDDIFDDDDVAEEDAITEIAGEIEETAAEEDAEPQEISDADAEDDKEEVAEPAPEPKIIEKDTVIVIEDEGSIEMESKDKATQPKKRSKIAMPLFITLIIVAVGVWGYLLMHFGIFDFDFDESNQKTATKTEQVDKNAGDKSTLNTNGEDLTENKDGTNNVTDNADGERSFQLEEPDETPIAIESETSEAKYGLKGEVKFSANDGYTIVLYSLSRESGAENSRKELENQGFRTLIKKIPSSKYGVLYRVSIGQFETEQDAQKAADENKDLVQENYLITKIN